jgi:DNA polymerase
VSELTDLAARIAGCQDCGLARTRTRAVPGAGPEHAEVMFVGEGPGYNEDQQGEPFVGQAGQFLNDLIRSVGMQRKDVFICNVVKCRPPGNRDPLPDEIAACRKHLERQIELIDPKVVVTLGRYSLQHFLPGQAISRVHGRPTVREGRHVLPMYHPAAALHQGSLRAVIIDDMKRLPEVLARAQDAAAVTTGPVAPAAAPTPVAAGVPQAEQGRLF